jgi:hypothetical protein
MKKEMIYILFGFMVLFSSTAFGHANYTGYSGAPGCNGTCASSCHGQSGGTVEISGFPQHYEPAQTYVIMVSHSGGNSIRQFNGSCRIGTGSENAGLITAGTNTSTYNNIHETNGIHFSSTNQNSGTFNWTAPSAGVGEVKMYIAGLQGGQGGNNSALVLASLEQTTGIEKEIWAMPNVILLAQNYPNPFNAQTAIEFSLNRSQFVRLTIYDLLGQEVATLIDGFMEAGNHTITFDASSLTSGVYFYRLRARDAIETRRMVLLK